MPTSAGLITLVARKREDITSYTKGAVFALLICAILGLITVLSGVDTYRNGNFTGAAGPVIVFAMLDTYFIIGKIRARKQYRELAEMICTESPDEVQAFLDDELQYGFETTKLEHLPPKWHPIVQQRAKERFVRSLIDRAAVAAETDNKIRTRPHTTTVGMA